MFLGHLCAGSGLFPTLHPARAARHLEPKEPAIPPGTVAPAVVTQTAETESARSREGQQFGRRLGDLILAEGMVTAEQLGQAVTEQTRTGQKLGAVLVRMGL